MITTRVPGDKSISHRAVLIAPLARSTSSIRGLSSGADVRSSLDVMRRLGASISCEDETDGGFTVRVGEAGGLTSPERVLDCGNSGTTARLLAGILVGSGVGGDLDGDASLRARPMRRIVYPLQAMGGRIEYLADPERLPMRVAPRATGSLRTLRHRARVASAQVKSSILLAGLTGGVRVEIIEPARSRDHTERMLAAMGAPIVFDSQRRGEGEVRLDPEGWDGRLRGLELEVPGDPSSAAFLIGAALLGDREVRIEGVGANPGRVGFLDVLAQMGASVRREPEPDRAGEPVETWTVSPAGSLRAFSIGGDSIPGLIDEVPLLAVLAARAAGRSEVRDAAELRLKESDRLLGVARNLEAMGVSVRERADGIEITGTTGPLEGAIETSGDHRLAMAFAVLGASADARLRIDDTECAAISFPGFWEAIEPFRREAGRPVDRPSETSRSGVGDEAAPVKEPRVIAIDGPAASGKSTTARSLARRLGFLHLNSGLLYRAITWWALEEGLDEQDEDFSRRVRDLSIGFAPSTDGLSVAIEGHEPGPALHSAAVAARVSAVSTLPAVRAVVLGRLRGASATHDLVCDGRDIGTTVFPDADLKVFLVAEASERARRRLLEGDAPIVGSAIEREAERLAARDRADASRELSPLRRAEDAVEIDTTDMTREQVVEAIVSLATRAGVI